MGTLSVAVYPPAHSPGTSSKGKPADERKEDFVSSPVKASGVWEDVRFTCISKLSLYPVPSVWYMLHRNVMKERIGRKATREERMERGIKPL